MKDHTSEARILARAFEKGMTAFGDSIERGLTAFGESIERGLTAIAESPVEKTNHCAPTDYAVNVKNTTKIDCENPDPHEPHLYSYGGLVAIYNCTGKGKGEERVMRELDCGRSFSHLPHEWTVRGGGAEGNEEVYCTGSPR